MCVCVCVIDNEIHTVAAVNAEMVLVVAAAAVKG